jgi:hypothetical protein
MKGVGSSGKVSRPPRGRPLTYGQWKYFRSPRFRAEFPGGATSSEVEPDRSVRIRVHLYEDRDVGFRLECVRLRLRDGIELNSASLDGVVVAAEKIHRQPVVAGRTDRHRGGDRLGWESVEIFPPWPGFMYQGFGFVDLDLSIPAGVVRTRFEIRPRTWPNDLTTERDWPVLDLIAKSEPVAIAMEP